MLRTVRAISATLMLALLAPLAAQAVPLTFSVTYDGSLVGPAGVGSFVYDADADNFDDFTFTFGNFTRTLLDVDRTDIFAGGTDAKFFFEILTGQDVHPAACSTGGGCSSGTILSDFSAFATFARSFANPFTSYTINDVRTGSTLFAGTATVSQVPEPASLALLGLGLFSVLLLRRRDRA